MSYAEHHRHSCIQDALIHLSFFVCVVFVCVSPLTPSATTAPSERAESSATKFAPNIKPVLTLTPCTSPIAIDGILDEEAWRDAAHAENFTEISPGDQVRPQVDTEVLVTYDRDNLYVAFLAHDDPQDIRASLRERDEIFNDDYVGIILDTYGNAAWAYEIFVNPLGVQGDLRWTPAGEDIGFDVVFHSKAAITDSGYRVEMAIPFKSLRFPDRKEQVWRISFWRNHPRDSRRRYSWATVSRDDPCELCQLGTLRGIRDVQPGRSIELLPALVGSGSSALEDADDPASSFRPIQSDLEGALGVRYGISSSVGAELTLNPDFSQVESDVAQIDVNTTFALFYPERRPFFQEGSDLLSTYWSVVYTRMINDPSVAFKVTHRTERTGFLLLGARDERTPYLVPGEERSYLFETGRSNSVVFRLRRSFREDSHVGTVGTTRLHDNGGLNAVLGADGSLRFRRNYRLKGQMLLSTEKEPEIPATADGLESATFDSGKHSVALDGERFSGIAVYSSMQRDARHWKSDLSYWHAGAAFRAGDGFIPRNDDRRFSWENAYVFYPDNRWLDLVKPITRFTRRWNGRSVRKAQSIENWVELTFKRQTMVSVGYDFNYESFYGVRFDDMRLFYGELNTAFTDEFHMGLWFGLGERIARTESPPALGKGAHVDAWAIVKPIQQMSIEPIFTYSMLKRKDNEEKVFEGYIARTRIAYQFTRELSLRFVLQYDDFRREMNVEPLLTYQLDPFTVFYVGSTTSYLDYGNRIGGFTAESYQIFFKFQYFFRI